MSRMAFRVVLLSSLLASSACTQSPAHIENNARQYFGRAGEQGKIPVNASRGNKYTPVSTAAKSDYVPYKPAPVYTNTASSEHIATEQKASVQSIGVADLAPPAAAKPAASVAAAPIAEKPIAEKETRASNPWTKNARSEADKPAPAIAASEPARQAKPAKFAASKESSSFMWPVNGRKVVSGFGPKAGGKVNDGVNIASAEGEPVWAAADGEVVYVGDEIKGYGNMVLIKHSGGKSTSYAHMSRATVDKYDRVKQGDIIGYVGSTGNVKEPQLHFAIRDGKSPVDPKKYLSTNLAGL